MHLENKQLTVYALTTISVLLLAVEGAKWGVLDSASPE